MLRLLYWLDMDALMFGIFRRKEKTPPPLSAELTRCSTLAAELVNAQISAFTETKPGWSLHNNDWLSMMTASYCWGAVCGLLQETGEDRKWAKGDASLAELALLLVVTPVFAAVFGADRCVKVHSTLPQANGRRPTDDLLMLERVGGEDAISFLQKRPPRWPGGGLHHFFVHNVN